ncbi:hypothetical protein AMAG_09131 [Allomyces macrogynus ATCC 38327]|uniref:Uncharacterized protein n=1 Tax=Allomyces macrogynus (strain ATCC 38327) TaxID=578462 RepID=A0A0L0SNJ3_ALLM3|nr:hypothetical protein AMAG_09131 [Allomyces macrogynus ATCC 38327]|eukprot:KNE64073.1 hypothetical protein AMAG_09131 [Allomyces macrogynus ATCC 38327]
MPPPPAPSNSTPTPASVRGSMRVHPLPPGLTHAANGGGGTTPIPDPFSASDRPASAGSTGSGARLTRPAPSAPLPPPPPAAGRIAPGLGSLGAFHVRADVPAGYSSGGVAGGAAAIGTAAGQQQPARRAGSVVSVPTAAFAPSAAAARPHADAYSPTAPIPVDAGDATDAAAHARILATLLAQQPPPGLGSATASATALLAPLPSAPDTRVNLTGAPPDRRASFFFNNVYVPLGIRKLNAMMAPAGGSGNGEMGNASGGLSRSSANSSGADLVGGGGGAGEEKGFLSFKLPPNFGSHVQLFAQLPSTDQKSLVVRKKEIYAQLSLIFGMLLIAFVVTDYVSLLVYLRVSVLRPWLMSIQILHVAAFYLFLLSFIYANEAGDLATLKKALGAFVVNLGAFLGRMVFDIQFDGYMPSSTT